MTFEEFEAFIWRHGFGIAACNHYSIRGERRLYCVVLSQTSDRAFKAEGQSSSAVFAALAEQVGRTAN